MTYAQPASQPRSPWVTAAIVAAVLIGLCFLCSICIFVALALSGPAVGNVFSSIITSLPPTPTP